MKKQSAGLLVYRKKNSNVEVLLVHPGGPFFVNKDVWGIPKGEYESGEDPIAVAHREFEEEIGRPAPENSVVDLGEIERSDGKIIKIWAVEGSLDVRSIKSNLFSLEWPPHSGKIQNFPEVDKARWFAINQTSNKLHKGQEIFIKRLADYLNIEIEKPNSGPDLPKPSEQATFL